MDPIFSYIFDESLYWQNYFIAYTGQPFTCSKIRCTVEEAIDIHYSLANNFGASYIIIEPRRSPNTSKNLKELEGFDLVFLNDTEEIYKILPIK